MDDCNLDKLGIKPGKLSPAFSKDTTDYSVTLASNVEKITFDCLTSDTGASYSISGSDGGRTVPLKEGMNEVKIEVTAEDGTVKNYMIHARCLSAKDATLSDLQISEGNLDPDFSPDVTEYGCLLPCNVSSLTVTPAVLDTKAAMTVNDDKPGQAINLNVGLTVISISVKSPDGSNTQSYKLNISKKQIPRYVKLVDPVMAMKYECPTSLSPLYQPISIKGSNPKHAFCGPIIDEFTKTCKQDPLNGSPLDIDWRVEDVSLDSELSKAQATIPNINGGSVEATKFGELGTKMKECDQTPKLLPSDKKFDSSCAPFKHTCEMRGWEKQMQQIFDESNSMKLTKMGDDAIAKYIETLPKPNSHAKFNNGEAPTDYLTTAIHSYATAIKGKKTDASLHMKLGLALEEKYYTEDLLGLKKDEGETYISGANLEAKESSKEEECGAICQLRGVTASSPLPLQLKAIDAEYQHLIQSGLSGKADHVMGLFQWKSKQATQEGAAAQKASDDQSPLGQAYLKYLDALSLDESKGIYHFHVGRVLCIQGEYSEAVKRLEATLGWTEKHQMARFYLGLALCLQKEGVGDRKKEAMGYILEAMEALLQQNAAGALNPEPTNLKPTALQAEGLVRNTNVHLLRGIIELGKILAKSPESDAMSAEDVFHTAALLASQALPWVAKGDAYKQFEWVLLEAHSSLIDILLEKRKDEVPLIAQRCERLSALIKNSTIPQSAELLALQEKTCQMLVQIKPCNSHALFLLGNTQLTAYENDPEGDKSAVYLESAKSSFLASVSMEGKPAAGDPPAELTGQKWWTEKAEEDKKKAAKAEEEKAAASKPAAAAAKPGAARGGAARGGAAGRGAPAGRGTPAGRGAATPARGGAAAKGPARGGAAAGRGAPAGRGTTPAARGGVKAAAAPAKGPVKATAPVAKTGSSHKCETTTAKLESAKPGSARPGSGRPGSASKRPASASKRPASAKKTDDSAKSAPINQKSYLPRLGLARVHSKNTDDFTDSKKYYNQVIDINPDLHDAYIESAELLTKTDPLGAVDIYCRFPVSENPTFDDAYIFGEVVRMLVKNDKLDDPRLETNMIGLGRVMGLGCLEKYVKILDDKFKTKTLKAVYAGVNGKAVDDPDLQAFFKMKCWN